MLLMKDYFVDPATPDDGRRASAGWMQFKSDDNKLVQGNDLRRSYILGTDLNFGREDDRNGNNFRTFVTRSFDEKNIDTVCQDLVECICGEGGTGIPGSRAKHAKSFELSILEIMRNSVEHSGRGGGRLSCVRTRYFASVCIVDYGVGFKKQFENALSKVDTNKFPKEVWDNVAIELARLEGVTTNIGRAENGGIGLPRLVASAEYVTIKSGDGLMTIAEGTVPALPEYIKTANLIKLPPRENQVPHSGVAIEAFFNLKNVSTRWSAYKPHTRSESEGIVALRYGEEVANELFQNGRGVDKK